MTSPTLTELAYLVERLTGPCREMDAEIAEAIMPSDAHRHAIINDIGLQCYTGSLDAAMLLAPSGWQRLVRDHNGRKDYDGDGKGKNGFGSVYDKGNDGPIYSAYGATPALALTAASLRARASMEADHG